MFIRRARSMAPLKVMAAAAAVVIASSTAACGSKAVSTPVPSGSGGDVSQWATASGDCDAQPLLKVNAGVAAPAKVEIQDLCEGLGAPITTQSTITANYIIKILRNGEVLSSTWKQGTPINTQVSNTLEGWKQGIVGMKIHGRRIVVIPATLAYGENPPASTPIKPGDSFVLLMQIEDAK